MKKFNVLHFGIGMITSMLILVLVNVLYCRSIPEKLEPYIANDYINFMIVKQNEDNIEYVGTFEKRHFELYPLATWERTEYTELGQWKYQVIMSKEMLVSDGYEYMTIINTTDGENTCRIIYYDDFVEINGITYKMPEGLDIENWLEPKWKFLRERYQWYGIETTEKE